MGLEKGMVNFVKMLTDDGAVGWWWLMLVLLDHVCLSCCSVSSIPAVVCLPWSLCFQEYAAAPAAKYFLLAILRVSAGYWHPPNPSLHSG